MEKSSIDAAMESAQRILDRIEKKQVEDELAMAGKPPFLTTEEFVEEARLVGALPPPLPRKAKTGDLVALTCNPERTMVVARRQDPGIVCQWLADDGKLMTGVFDPKLLRAVGRISTQEES